MLLGARSPRHSVDAALELYIAGLTRGVLHPAAVTAAARLISVPVRFPVL